ncbi:MAG: putative glycoside hydrolase [Acidimicrobiia bacterium]|nr:putative glycoside hydrolase [Acidimicrobiia bacterium]
MALTIAWAVWAGWSLITRATPYELHVIDDLGVPVAGVSVDISGRQAGTSGDDGRLSLEWSPSMKELTVSAPGHVPQVVTIMERPDRPVQVVIKARILRGQVVDDDGNPVPDVVISTAAAEGRTDSQGLFDIRGAEPGPVTVTRPAWIEKIFEWDGSPGDALIQIEPFTARAVHISGDAVATRFDSFIQMAMDTELNALMVDLKDEMGLVWYDTENPTAIAVGADHGAYDLAEVVRRAHAEGLYVIGRLVVFNDPIAAQGRPSMAVWDSDLQQPYSSNGQYFLDPTDPEARQYGLELAIEACSKGLDEVQFDYVRFPDERGESATFDEGVSPEVRSPTIVQFLSDAVAALHPMGCAVAADVFGFITTVSDDGKIGQTWEEIAAVVDVVSPMVYPSHYSTGWFNYDVPNDHPGPVVREALADGIERLPRNVVVRPWLQDFGYDANQVRAQILSAEEFGLGWMLWNAASNVTMEALRPE